jgi:hypothetical protein
MIRTITIAGVQWSTIDSLSGGDYSNSAAIGEANRRAILAMVTAEQRTDNIAWKDWEEWAHGRVPYFPFSGPPSDVEILVELRGHYGAWEIWVRDDDNREDCAELREILGGLSHYPLIDDGLHSEVEREWEEESWDNYIRADLLRELRNHYPEWVADYAAAMECSIPLPRRIGGLTSPLDQLWWTTHAESWSGHSESFQGHAEETSWVYDNFDQAVSAIADAIHEHARANPWFFGLVLRDIDPHDPDNRDEFSPLVHALLDSAVEAGILPPCPLEEDTHECAT